MLVISRHVNEAIKIGDDITVTIIKASDENSLIHIGIDAPREVKIYREEIFSNAQIDKYPGEEPRPAS